MHMHMYMYRYIHAIVVDRAGRVHTKSRQNRRAAHMLRIGLHMRLLFLRIRMRNACHGCNKVC